MTIALENGESLEDAELTARRGLGTYRYVNCSGKVKIADTVLRRPSQYNKDDDYSGICLYTGDGYGYDCKLVKVNGLHVAFRCCDNFRQNVRLDHCVVDSKLIGINQDWVFGLMGRTAGLVQVIKGQMKQGGSYRNPNKSHRIYIGSAATLSIDGWHSYNNIAGRDVQVYDGDDVPIEDADYWHINNSVIERHKLLGYSAVQTNPRTESFITQTTILNDYCCVEANGDVHLTDCQLVGGGPGDYSAGVRAMRDNIRIILERVDNRCPIPVDLAGHTGVTVEIH